MKQPISKDFLMETLYLLHQKLPVGVEVKEEDWNKAYEIIYTKAVIDTIEWKLENITIQGDIK